VAQGRHPALLRVVVPGRVSRDASGVTTIDTSTNYLGFRSHETLARTAGDLLPKFTISTKVGYFRRPGRAEHSLDPLRLRAAMEQAARDLGREPDLVFLHNPEHSLHETVPHSRDALTRACTAPRRRNDQGAVRRLGHRVLGSRTAVGSD
jgi:aryl-alcohol dehydrogenase-like predicted oxidoreductase